MQESIHGYRLTAAFNYSQKLNENFDTMARKFKKFKKFKNQRILDFKYLICKCAFRTRFLNNFKQETLIFNLEVWNIKEYHLRPLLFEWSHLINQ